MGQLSGDSVYILFQFQWIWISHFRYNERAAGLKLRQTCSTWSISKQKSWNDTVEWRNRSPRLSRISTRSSLKRDSRNEYGARISAPPPPPNFPPTFNSFRMRDALIVFVHRKFVDRSNRVTSYVVDKSRLIQSAKERAA